MEISGNQKVKAPRQQVFQALWDPEVLKNSIPGCEGAEFVDFPTGRQLKLVISTSVPGFKGPFNIFLQNGEQTVTGLPPVADAFSRTVYIAEPTTSFSSVKATCVINLADDPEGTMLSYTANAEVSGKIANVPDIVINGTVKMGMGQFFKNFEKQVSAARV
jgi:carbon monoxide dehydrogenase subunit G